MIERKGRPNLPVPLLTVALGTPNFNNLSAMLIPVTLANAGLGNAVQAQITSVAVTALAGRGFTLLTGVPSPPALLGQGASTVVPLSFSRPGGHATVSLTFQLNARTTAGLNCSATQTVKLSF
jgi:hypothetical protein